MNDKLSDTLPNKFANIIHGSRGVVYLGQGSASKFGEIVEIGDDYVLLDTEVNRYVIPVSSIVYWRFAREDE